VVVVQRYFFSDEMITEPGMTLMRKWQGRYVYFCVMPFALESLKITWACVKDIYKERN
jgi:hypothetical protein